MNFKPILYVNGILLLILSLAMFAPMMVDLVNHNADWKVFAGSQIITTFIGFLLIFANREKQFQMTIRETFLMTGMSWLFMAAFGSLPFVLADIQLSFTKAFFESMSGITATGATVLSGLDHLPHGILLWRAILHWLGGIGFLIIALAILPLLQISGMQIFKTQSFDIEKVLPSASQMAIYICGIYVTLSFLCTIFLYQSGMTFFEAICHAMSTLSSGGFSTSDGSIGHFNSPVIETVIMYFMILSGIPFVLYMRMTRGDMMAVLRDEQVQAFLKTILFFASAMTLYLFYTGPYGVVDTIRHAAFKVISLVSTTGFATEDYGLWGPFALAMAFVMTFMGACSGSTAGGMKMFRIQILWRTLRLQIRRLITPNGMFQVRYNKKPVDMTVQNAVGIFFFAYIALFLLAGSVLMLEGLDFMTAFSASLASISNVGPGLGDMVGPSGNYGSLGAVSIWVLSACMLLGRLEIFTLLVLLFPNFWKR